MSRFLYAVAIAVAAWALLIMGEPILAIGLAGAVGVEVVSLIRRDRQAEAPAPIDDDQA